ncbi:MAG: hypothetical protein PHS92_05090 [Candidatus Gracilibacteria bacterium]|nr:hypothetical protein [Candidatus Gracilibacteria bacterium]
MKKGFIEIKMRINGSSDYISAYTDRIDAIFGASSIIINQNNPLIEKLGLKILNKGIFAINPFNSTKLPIFISYNIGNEYETGVIISIPAHNESDFKFAKKNNLPIIQSIVPESLNIEKYIKLLKTAQLIEELSSIYKIPAYLSGGIVIPFNSGVVFRQNNDLDYFIKIDRFRDFAEMLCKNGFHFIDEYIDEDSGEKNIIKLEKEGIEVEIIEDDGFSVFKEGERFEFGNDDIDDKIKTLWGFKSRTINLGIHEKIIYTAVKYKKTEKKILDIEMLKKGAFTNDGKLINSGIFSGLKSKEAEILMIKWLEEKGIGGRLK